MTSLRSIQKERFNEEGDKMHLRNLEAMFCLCPGWPCNPVGNCSSHGKGRIKCAFCSRRGARSFMSIDLEVILTWHYDIDYLVDGHISAAVTSLSTRCTFVVAIYCNRVLVILIVHNVWRTALTPCSCSSSVFTVHLLLAIGTKRRLMLWPGGINSISSDTKSRLGSGRVSHLIHTWFLLSCSVVAADIAEKAHLGHVAHSV